MYKKSNVVRIDQYGDINPSRYGGWMQVYTGGKFYPLDPRPEEIFIEDIAHALSLLCRYVGHIKRFYSVAEHCWYVSERVSKENALWGLLHDATEAYLSDISHPLKYMPEMAIYKKIEKDVQKVICARFGLSETEPQEVKDIENRLLANETRDLFPKRHKDWHWKHKSLRKLYIAGYQPQQIEKMYLDRFYELGGKYVG